MKEHEEKDGERLGRRFFERDPVTVAEQLIGCCLVRRLGEETIRIRLTETEAYAGAEDPASHAFRGPTPRNRPMFGEAGRLYVYLSYGIHYCVNVVTGLPGEASAVLLRGGTALSGIDAVRARRPGVPDKNLLNGPGKLAQSLGIALDMNGYTAVPEDGSEPAALYFEQGAPAGPVLRTPRIGISRGQELLWRFIESSGAKG